MISKGTVKSKRIMEQKEGKCYPKQKKYLQRPFSGDKREEKLYYEYEKSKRILAWMKQKVERDSNAR